MILLDSNVPMYLVGAPHPNRDQAASILRSLAARRERLVTDAEVYQEILHRYTHLHRPEAITDAFAVLDQLVDEVLPISGESVHLAAEVLADHPGLGARDSLHVAVMQQHGVSRILTYDRAFDQVPGIERLA